MSRQSTTLGDNDAKCPDAEIDDVHTRNSLASPMYLQEREASASLLQPFTHKEKPCSNVHSQFLASMGMMEFSARIQ